eukprot:TRINITY_DN6863_c0_g3_i2.p3 TRINITY_DN6863_c0_g3~~TRINITY_DN6863_c0_g3_i2.p3  ORF type:complete len:206 (-),score=43.79 TRINITY_DN6863_c0_g3_i2:1577-2194(-)
MSEAQITTTPHASISTTTHNPHPSLLIIGCGELGEHLLENLHSDKGYQDWKIFAETRTKGRHAKYIAAFPNLKLTMLSTEDTESSSSMISFDNILVCVPPTQLGAPENYVRFVGRSLQRWNRSGSFVFVSSTSACLRVAGCTTPCSDQDQDPIAVGFTVDGKLSGLEIADEELQAKASASASALASASATTSTSASASASASVAR